MNSSVPRLRSRSAVLHAADRHGIVATAGRRSTAVTATWFAWSARLRWRVPGAARPELVMLRRVRPGSLFAVG